MLVCLFVVKHGKWREIGLVLIKRQSERRDFSLLAESWRRRTRTRQSSRERICCDDKALSSNREDIPLVAAPHRSILIRQVRTIDIDIHRVCVRTRNRITDPHAQRLKEIRLNCETREWHKTQQHKLELKSQTLLTRLHRWWKLASSASTQVPEPYALSQQTITFKTS